MRAATGSRVSGALWYLPLAFALGVYVGLSDASDRSGYHVADLASASRCVVLLAPLQAAYVALRFRGFPALVTDLRPRRGGLRVVFAVWGWLLLGAPVAAGLSMLSATHELPRTTPEWEILEVVFAAVLASGLLGLTAARWIPSVVAIPGVALLTFGWLALPGAGTEILIRNINSGFVGCCSSQTRPAPAMVTGSLVVTGVLAAGCTALLLPRRWSRTPRPMLASVTLILLLGAIGSGASAARAAGGQLNLLAVAARSTALTCAHAGQVEACAWPEDRERLSAVLEAADHLNGGLAGVGLPRARRLSEGRLEGDDIAFRAPPISRETDLLYAVSVGYVQRQEVCRPAPLRADSDTAIAFVARLGGLGEQELGHRLPPASIQAARSALALSPEKARDWFHDAVCPREESGQ